MLHAGWSSWWGLGLFALVVLTWIGFGPRARRLERRRRKSHNRVVSKTGRPMVKFSVRPHKEK